jgi:hypothetical protein
MKESMVIMEVVLKQQLLAQRLAGHQGRPLSVAMLMTAVQRLAGHQGRPLSVAMLMTAVDHFCQLGEPEAEIRALFERVLATFKHKRVVMPSPNEIKELTGEKVAKALDVMLDEKAEKSGQKPNLCEHGNLMQSCTIGECG